MILKGSKVKYELHYRPTTNAMIYIWLQVRYTSSTDSQLVTLNPRGGERAVLIKNNKGDWGIVTGKWTGFIKGVAGVRGMNTLWVNSITHPAYVGAACRSRVH